MNRFKVFPKCAEKLAWARAQQPPDHLWVELIEAKAVTTLTSAYRGRSVGAVGKRLLEARAHKRRVLGRVLGGPEFRVKRDKFDRLRLQVRVKAAGLLVVACFRVILAMKKYGRMKAKLADNRRRLL